MDHFYVVHISYDYESWRESIFRTEKAARKLYRDEVELQGEDRIGKYMYVTLYKAYFEEEDKLWEELESTRQKQSGSSQVD